MKNTTNFQVQAAVEGIGTLCKGQKVMISGPFAHSIISAKVDGNATSFTNINDTHTELWMPPVSAASALSTLLPGMRLDAAPHRVTRAISVQITAHGTIQNMQQSFAVRNITYVQPVGLQDLSCGLNARYTFSGSLVGVGPLAHEGFTVSAPLNHGSIQKLPSSLSPEHNGPAAQYGKGRKAMINTSADARTVPIVLPVVHVPEYTVAAWIQIPAPNASPPTGWTTDVHLNGTCTSKYPTDNLEVSSCWKFVAMRRSATKTILTVGAEVINPEHHLAKILQVRMAQSKDHYIGLSEVIVDDLWYWDRILFDQELLQLRQTDVFAIQIGDRDGASGLLMTMDESIKTPLGLAPGLTRQRASGSKEFISAEELVELELYSTEDSEDYTAEITCFVEVEAAGTYVLRTITYYGLAITANNQTMSDLNNADGDLSGRDVEVVMKVPGFIALNITIQKAWWVEGTTNSFDFQVLIKNSTDISSEFVSASVQAVSGQWTVAMWMWPSVTEANAKVIASADNWQIVAQGNAIQVMLAWDQCEFSYAYDCSGVDSFIFEDVALVEGMWNHLVVSYSGSAVTVHVSGRQSSVATDPEHHSVGPGWLKNIVVGTLDVSNDDNKQVLKYQLYSVRLVARVVSDNEVAAMHECSSTVIANTVIHHVFEEGFGTGTQHIMPANSAIDEGMASFSTLHNAVWVNSTCAGAQGLPGAARLCGSPYLKDMAAGQVARYSLEALDACGRTHKSGGSCVTVRVFAGDKAWMDSTCPDAGDTTKLDSSDGMLQVVDRHDGSYDVTQRFSTAGLYNVSIDFNNTGGQWTVNEILTVHPGIANASMSYIEGVLTAGGLSPTINATVGVPYKLRVHLLDSFGNVKDWSNHLDGEFEVDVSFNPKQPTNYSITDNEDGTLDIDYLMLEPGASHVLFLAISLLHC
jgi:hypothetical protein